MDQLGNEDEAVTDPKPYDIPKRRVLEAYWHVRANKGAAGIDDESIEMFEEDLTGNLYKLILPHPERPFGPREPSHRRGPAASSAFAAQPRSRETSAISASAWRASRPGPVSAGATP
jgi:hypothetical protein